ncbi:probable aminoacyl tRNA synthase complex-interacting multifunctional protein 2 isoform X2 [Teleopsis dalmanni]|uniref:probable aminoacyl tRNA synthase complex-interacting multifunctional protein 2 isoform X2 n=1 Tax=Teleopsis dalmanni TaxID=139649 RepID=UPI0018CD4A58|nr:probable aminoacyl tRNA synthase complex-interacting multifunctional protein 2 isoform X2 [Teleopsis dalmanni]
MYELKTLLPQFDIKLPTCMYALKNVSLSADACARNNTSNGVDSICNSSSESKAIIVRQDKVLQQLNELKAQLAGIRSTLGLCQKGPQHTNQYVGKNGGLREEPLHDVVINGHPNFIPYALLALKNAWKDLFTIDIKTFTHSTMADIGPDAREFEKKLAAVPVNESIPKINVTLIWKNCEHTEMISSPTMYVPIYGEVNIIRYLGRVGPAEYRYEDSPLCNEIDAVLDICYQLLRCTTAKSRANMIRSLNNRLQKQKYFGGNEMSIADIGVHTSLKRMPAITEKDLTPALNEWRKRAQLVTMI